MTNVILNQLLYTTQCFTSLSLYHAKEQLRPPIKVVIRHFITPFF